MPTPTNKTTDAPKKAKATETKVVHEPQPDHTGAILTDRALTPNELAAQDAKNRQALIEQRKNRFHARLRRG